MDFSGMRFRKKRAAEMAEDLAAAKREKRGVLRNGVRKPQADLPMEIKRGSREHALYYLYSAPLTARAQSEAVFKAMRKMYDVGPKLFEPAEVRRMGLEDFTKVAKPFLPHGNKGAKRWYDMSVKLEEYGDDPRKIFSDTTDVNVALERLYKFDGYAEKMGSMVCGWFSDEGFAKFGNKFELRIPVDVHVIRISAGQGAMELDRPERHERIMRFLEENYYRLFKKRPDLDAFEYQESLWNVGAYQCSKRVCVNGCPFRNPCVRTIDKTLYTVQGLVDMRPFSYQSTL